MAWYFCYHSVTLGALSQPIFTALCCLHSNVITGVSNCHPFLWPHYTWWLTSFCRNQPDAKTVPLPQLSIRNVINWHHFPFSSSCPPEIRRLWMKVLLLIFNVVHRYERDLKPAGTRNIRKIKPWSSVILVSSWPVLSVIERFIIINVKILGL